MGELAVSGYVYICFSRKMPCRQGFLGISVRFFSYTFGRTRDEIYPRLGADAFVSAPRRARIWELMHSYLGADALASGTAFVGKYKERIGRDMDCDGKILIKVGVPNYFLLFA